MLENLYLGFTTATNIVNIFYCFLGVSLGTIVGILPGIGSLASVAILLPLSYKFVDPTTSIIFLAGIYYGSQYGGSITSIMFNMPGEIASAVTTMDGHSLAKRGRAGAALTITAFASFIGGTVSAIFMAGFAFHLAEIAYLFAPADYASLMLLGLIASVMSADGPLGKCLFMIAVGSCLAMIGTDLSTGQIRFTAGIDSLREGLPIAVLAIGLFGIGEILFNFFGRSKNISYAVVKKVKSLYPTKEEIKQSINPTARGTFIGSILGLLPGGGPIIASFMAYFFEKYISKKPKQFGKGSIAGIASPEAANNAASQTCFLPTLILGLPITPVMAVMSASLILNGIQPGQTLLEKNTSLFWGLIVSLWIGNLMLLILNVPMVKIFIKILSVPRQLLYILIFTISTGGIYFLRQDWIDIVLLFTFGLAGFLAKLKNFPITPLLMSFVISPLFKEYFQRTLIINNGNYLIFIKEPISLFFLSLTLFFLMYKLLKKR